MRNVKLRVDMRGACIENVFENSDRLSVCFFLRSVSYPDDYQGEQ